MFTDMLLFSCQAALVTGIVLAAGLCSFRGALARLSPDGGHDGSYGPAPSGRAAEKPDHRHPRSARAASDQAAVSDLRAQAASCARNGTCGLPHSLQPSLISLHGVAPRAMIRIGPS